MTARGAKPDVWMPFFVGDYLADTARLTTEQHGAYVLLILDYWRNGAPPADDAVLAQITRMERKAWLKLRPVIARYFAEVDGHWRHKRIEEELTAAQQRSDKAATRATTAATVRWERERAKQSPEQCSGHAPSIAPSSASDMLEECPSPSPSPMKRDADASLVGSAEPMPTEAEASTDKPKAEKAWTRDRLFREAWTACTDAMRARSAARDKTWPAWARAAIAAGGPDRLLVALKAYVASDKDVERTGGPGFHRWLQDGKWQHWLSSAEAGSVAPVWRGPPELRAAAAALKGEPWCISYLDRCAWRDLPDRALVPHNGFSARVIRSEIGDLLDRSSITIQEQAA